MPATAEQPYFLTTTNPTKRVAALRTARDLDGTKFNGQMLVEGSEFKKVVDSFHDEDYGPKKPKAAAGKKMLAREAVETLKGTYQSAAVRSILDIVLGGHVEEMPLLDDAATLAQTKVQMVESYLPRLKPEVAAVVRLCLVSPDPTAFQEFLEANLAPEPEPEPEAESFPLTEEQPVA